MEEDNNWEERAKMLGRMFSDVYSDAIEYKEERDELLEAAKASLNLIKSEKLALDKHLNIVESIIILEEAIAKAEGNSDG